jgi:hypothetical protein
MNGIGNDFHPSRIEDQIYDLINESDYIASSSEYERTVGPAIMEYLENCGVQFNMIEDPYPDMTGASLSICWIEGGHLHHIVLNIRY